MPSYDIGHIDWYWLKESYEKFKKCYSSLLYKFVIAAIWHTVWGLCELNVDM